jgi:hypothetical protein
MTVAIGERAYKSLPQYIAVQVSAERWRVAELVGTCEEGFAFPAYQCVSEPLKQGTANNLLCEWQRQWSKKLREAAAQPAD